MLKDPEKKPPTSIINPDTGIQVKKNLVISVSYVSGFSEEFRRIF